MAVRKRPQLFTVLLVGGQQKGAAAVANAAIGLFSVAVWWLSVHTMYTLRYARFYYSQPEAPIDFNNAEPPGSPTSRTSRSPSG